MPKSLRKIKFDTIGGIYGIPRIPKDLQLDQQKWQEARVNKGIITSIDASDIPLGSLRRAQNITVRYDKTSRRPGTSLFGPTKPDSNPVLRIAGFKLPDGTGYTIRFTPSSIYILDLVGNSWDQVAGTLNGTVTDRFNVAIILDRVVFSNNGADPIQEIDVNTNTFAQLGNAPNYRYITGFFNRVVGAAERGINEVEVGWSAEYPDIEEWDPLVNETAGNSPIVESPSDLGDHIKGIFGISTSLVLMRERSVWLATKQAIPTNPFNFYPVIPGIGCDLPDSIAVMEQGLAWTDFRTQMVYAWSIGGSLEYIGQNVYKEIFRGIDDPNRVFGVYDPVEAEYTVHVPVVGSNSVPGWTYNFRTKTWAYNEHPLLTTVDDVELLEGYTAIDDLIGNIDDLIGTIDELSPASEAIPARLLGFRDGELATVDPEIGVDRAPENLIYETEIVSKRFVIPSFDTYVAKITIEYQFLVDGSFNIEYSIDGGDTDDFWRPSSNTITVNPNGLLRRRLIKTYRRVIKAEKFAFRIVANSGVFDILGYEIWVYPARESTSRGQDR